MDTTDQWRGAQVGGGMQLGFHLLFLLLLRSSPLVGKLAIPVFTPEIPNIFAG